MIANIAITTDSLLACAVCMGGDDATTTAANLAIGFMAVLILTVLGSVMKFAHYLSRQQKLAAMESDVIIELDSDQGRAN